MIGYYENKDGRGALERSGTGTVLFVDGGMTKSADLPPSATTDTAIEGLACKFNAPHTYKGAIDVFAPGAFDETLANRDEVEFRVTHEGKAIATTRDRLELVSDRKGLAFRLTLSDGDGFVADLVRDRKMEAVSPGYTVLESEQRRTDGVFYRLIIKARLNEISLVRRGAVKQTFAKVVDASKCAPLVTELKSASFGAESAFARLMRTLQDNKETL